MTIGTPLRVIAAIALVMCSLTIAAPASAQIPPIPLPPIPSELDPVLDLVSPLVNPQCANLAFVFVLVPALVGTGGVDVGPLFGPVFVACASVPIPEESEGFTCTLDEQIGDLVSTVSLQALGIPSPVAATVLGPVLTILNKLEALLNPQKPPAIGGLLAAPLSCSPYEAPAPVEPEPEETAVVPAPTSTTTSTTTPIVASAPTPTAPVTTPAAPATTLAPAPVAELAATPASSQPGLGRWVGFAYPAMLLLPLLLLAVGGYLGRTMTTEVRLPD